MSEEELAALRRAWSDVPAPPPFRELEQEDADTRRAVEWLHAALRSATPAREAAPPARHSAPPPRVDAPPRFARRPRLRLLPRLLALTAAAGLLALLGRTWMRNESASAQPPSAFLPPPALPEPAPPAAAAEPAPPAPAPPRVELLASNRERVEMRAGPVRLTLLHEPSAPPTPPQPEKP